MTQKPRFLYHGSSEQVAVLRPFRAHDRRFAAGRHLGVYATSRRRLALAFALGAVPDRQGTCHREVLGKEQRIVFFRGHPNLGGRGYLCRLSPRGFREVSPGQWVCDHAVTPLTVTEVRVDDHARLLRYAMEQEKARYGLGDSAGYEPLAQYIPPTDGTVAARLRAAGAVILGKTNVPVLLGDIQTDNPIFGRTNYPWNIDRTPEGPAAVLRRRLLPDSYLWR